MATTTVRQVLAGTLGLMLLAGTAAARVEVTGDRTPAGGSAEGLPAQYENVGIEERRGGQVPLDLTFTDDKGKTVKLRDCLKPGKPALLQIGYFGCPMLCDLVSKGMIKSVSDLKFTAGDDFTLIYVSIDPTETWGDGQIKKRGYLEEYGRPAAADGWRFLVGPDASVKALTDAVGFKYKWLPDIQQFSHAAGIFVLTPDGKLSQYLYGVQFPEKTLRLSLVEASEGKVGSALDRLILYCSHYDPKTGKYSPAAMNIMRLGGGLTVLVLGAVLVPKFVRDARRAGAPAAATTGDIDETTTTTTTKETAGGR